MRRWAPLLVSLTAFATTIVAAGFSSADPAVAPRGSASAVPSGSASAVAAPRVVDAEVVVLHGTNTGKGIDPSLAAAAKSLQKPPFSAFDSYKLLAHSKVELGFGGAATIVLPDKGTLTLELKEQIAPGRFRVLTNVTKPSGNPLVKNLEVSTSSDAKEPFFVAGSKFDGGVLVVGIRLVK